jgi:hypothetical protein
MSASVAAGPRGAAGQTPGRIVPTGPSRSQRRCFSSPARWVNGLILGYLMYRTGLVPKPAAWLGLIGGPLIIITGTAIMFAGSDPSSTLRSLQGVLHPRSRLGALPRLYCSVWGFRRAPHPDREHPDDGSTRADVRRGARVRSRGRGRAIERQAASAMTREIEWTPPVIWRRGGTIAYALVATATTAPSTNRLGRPSGSVQLPMSPVAFGEAGHAAEDVAEGGAGGEDSGREERRACA